MSDTETRFEDGARLAWLADQGLVTISTYGDNVYVSGNGSNEGYGETLREAIDNARQKEQL